MGLHYADELRCMFEVLAISTAGFGLLAIWVALGRGPWFVRVVIAGLAVAFLLPIRAYEPALLFIVTLSATAMLLALPRYRTGRFQVCRESTHPPSQSSERKVFRVGVLSSCVIVFLALNWMNGFGNDGWYDRLLVLTFMGPLTVVIFNAIGQRVLHGRWAVSMKPPDGSTSIRLNLRDLLLGVAVIAAACGIATISLHQRPLHDWRGFFISAACLVAVTCSACGATTAHRWYWRCLSLVLLIATLVSTPLLHVWWSSDWMSIRFLWFTQTPSDVILGLSIFSVICALIILAGTFLLLAAGLIQTVAVIPDRPKMATRLARFAVVSVLIGAYLSLMPLYVKMLGEFESPMKVIPHDAGYSRLIAAARELQRINGRERTMSELQRIGQNQTADEVAEQYHILDNLVAEPFCVSPHYDHRDPSVQQELYLVRGLARVWGNESAQSSQRGQFDAAGERSLLNVSLGSGMSVGGLLVHSLVGVAVESVGQQGLTRIRHDLSIDKTADLFRRLQRIESQRESISTLVGRFNIWSDRIETWRFRVALHAAPVLRGRSPQKNHSIAIIAPTIQAFEEALRRRDTIHRLLMTELALRLYRHQKAAHPNELADLVPAFLSAVPIDPYSGDPLIFRRTDENYLLYSVGRDGDDDGGRFGTFAATLSDESYDFDIETLWRPDPIPTTATPQSSN